MATADHPGTLVVTLAAGHLLGARHQAPTTRRSSSPSPSLAPTPATSLPASRDDQGQGRGEVGQQAGLDPEQGHAHLHQRLRARTTSSRWSSSRRARTLKDFKTWFLAEGGPAGPPPVDFSQGSVDRGRSAPAISKTVRLQAAQGQLRHALLLAGRRHGRHAARLHGHDPRDQAQVAHRATAAPDTTRPPAPPPQRGGVGGFPRVRTGVTSPRCRPISVARSSRSATSTACTADTRPCCAGPARSPTELGVETVVAVTFDPHPFAVLRPEHAPVTLSGDRGARLRLAGAARRRRRAGRALQPGDRRLVARGVRRPGHRGRAARPRRRGRRQLPLRPQGRRRRRAAHPRGRARRTSRSWACPWTAARRCWSSTYVRNCLVGR